jgi:hypothetical protein
MSTDDNDLNICPSQFKYAECECSEKICNSEKDILITELKLKLQAKAYESSVWKKRAFQLGKEVTSTRFLILSMVYQGN